eukprot:TRINITY_DN10057_c0_g1_i1.p1 TRINITY_DN10057_c0_g1~~TRINITY_DN10057_c0_g1_i1.p1  ORF type:complete len:1540 (+),score=753.29 TRINITY_DN10057_c0_g1_i1:74-4693(+)
MRHLLFFILALSLRAYGLSDSKLVNVQLKANWAYTPLIAEISEFLAEEGNDLFWKFFEDVSPLSEASSESDVYNVAVTKASELLSKIQLDLLEFSTALRFFSPRVQLHRQIAGSDLNVLPAEQLQKSLGCSTGFVVLDNEVFCDAAALSQALSHGTRGGSAAKYDFDHVYPGGPADGPVSEAVLYGEIGSQAVLDLHTVLRAQSVAGRVRYIFRHYFVSKESMLLPGYGVELAIKSLEYKAVDDSKVEGAAPVEQEIGFDDNEDVKGFMFGTLAKRKPELAAELSNFRSFLSSQNEQFEDLKVWNIKDLGFLAAQRVAGSSHPLRLMREISQNFPLLATSLAKLKLNETLKADIIQNPAIEAGRSLVLVNGRVVDPDTADAFSLYTLLREEASKLDAITKLHIPASSAFKLLSLAPAKGSGEEEQASADRFLVHHPTAIHYFNDLEKDAQYRQWDQSTSGLMKRVWPGSFRYVARNFFTAVVVINPTSEAGLHMFAVIDSMFRQNMPLRYGVLFATEDYRGYAQKLRATDEPELEITGALKAARLFLNVKQRFGSQQALFFMKELEPVNGDLPDDVLEAAFNSFMERFNIRGNRAKMFSDAIADTQYDDVLRASNTLVVERGFDDLPLAFVNGVPCPGVSPQEVFQGMVGQVFYQTPELQKLVRGGKINDRTADIYGWIMKELSPLTRFSRLVLPSEANPVQFVSLAKDSTAELFQSLAYATKPGHDDDMAAVTQLLAVDLSTSTGRDLALEAVRYLSQDKSDAFIPRVAFLDNAAADSPVAALLSRAIAAASATQPADKALPFLSSLLAAADVSEDSIQKLASESGFKMRKFNAAWGDATSAAADAFKRASLAKQLGAVPGRNTIITNGRVITIPDDTIFSAADFGFLASFEWKKRVSKMMEVLDTVGYVDIDADSQTNSFISDVAMKVGSVLGLDEAKGVRKFKLPSYLPTAITVAGSSEKPASFHIVAILDPLSVAAQRISPILEVLVNLFDVRLDLVFNPVELTTLPLKNFYSYVLPAKVEFDASGAVQGPSATFSHLPPQRLLTLIMDTPSPWLISPVQCRYDLDNIKLQDLTADKVLSAVFELEHVLLEGNCYDMSNVNMMGMPVPPRGLELLLGSDKDADLKKEDTLVMSNFGYFQLKSNPGVWDLKLKDGSRSADVYEIVNADNGKQSAVVSDFLGNFASLRVKKRPGKENVQLLIEEKAGPAEDTFEDPDNIWESFSGFFGGSDSARGTRQATIAPVSGSNETIHIFSLASGLLYERFLKIMILSVLKTTNNPVKFWLIANFLSPKFKDFIPHYAKHYNFEYELVTYKWPSWLHKQTEKQRIIWGYKILFLDVLFPIDLKKVIYVDADQVVRSDIKELWDMDLHGAPYAYTPFCSDNKEMDGFRFWTQGFWQTHLRDLPYHISALYVVDLARFRRVAAGDQLRATYAQLSQDPNSLANLDQDLPNYMQHNVRIHSLPQEWLWCETWCSEESKGRAKTIDLCNNPMTKLPKLEAAVKILPEWTGYDNEIKALEKAVASGEKFSKESLQDAS